MYNGHCVRLRFHPSDFSLSSVQVSETSRDTFCEEILFYPWDCKSNGQARIVDELLIKSRSVRLIQLNWITVILHIAVGCICYILGPYPPIVTEVQYFQTLIHFENFDMTSTREMRNNSCMYTEGISVLIGKLCLMGAINFVYICEYVFISMHVHCCSVLFTLELY